MQLEAHRAYFAPYDGENFIVFDDSGALWEGSANLIALPSRAHVDAFLSEEPFYTNGLYYHVLVERYKFGGRPGQIVWFYRASLSPFCSKRTPLRPSG